MSDYNLLMERIKSNLDVCETVEVLGLSIDDLITLLGGVIYERRDNFEYLLNDEYKEL